MIYFDYTATTKPRSEVLEVYNKVNNELLLFFKLFGHSTTIKSLKAFLKETIFSALSKLNL